MKMVKPTVMHFVSALSLIPFISMTFLVMHITPVTRNRALDATTEQCDQIVKVKVKDPVVGNGRSHGNHIQAGARQERLASLAKLDPRWLRHSIGGT